MQYPFAQRVTSAKNLQCSEVNKEESPTHAVTGLSPEARGFESCICTSALTVNGCYVQLHEAEGTSCGTVRAGSCMAVVVGALVTHDQAVQRVTAGFQFQHVPMNSHDCILILQGVMPHTHSNGSY